MMSIVFHRLVVALSVVAFVSGMTMQAMPSAQALGPGTAERIAKADPECPRMAMEHHGDTIPTPRRARASCSIASNRWAASERRLCRIARTRSVYRLPTASWLTGHPARRSRAETSSPISFLP